jgi:TetR/AcrR family transcriptional regulator, repressor of fatR-cypB operon
MREKDPEKLAAIFSATLKTVLREGFSGLKMSSVAKEAGVATGTLYVYFASKGELINELYLMLKKEAATQFLNGYTTGAPFMVNFERIWKNYLFTQLKHPEAAAFLEQYYRSPFLKQTVKAETDKLLAPIFELLEAGKRERLVKDVPTELLVIQLSGAIGELVRWYASGQLTADEAIVNSAFRMAWDSIKQ